MTITVLDIDREGKEGGTLYQLTAEIRITDIDRDEAKARKAAHEQIDRQIQYLKEQLI